LCNKKKHCLNKRETWGQKNIEILRKKPR
jgi:hypothetical protein